MDTYDNKLKKNIVIGIYGGTFDPIHTGHLRIALEVQCFLGLQQVRFIPLALAAHKATHISSSADRLAMLQAAIKPHPSFTVDQQELKRKGTSYTVDTLISLREQFPDTPLIFMLGSDAYNHFHQWHQPKKILELCHLLVMQRPNETNAQHFQIHHTDNPNTLQTHLAGKILFHSVIQLDISSSHIRQQVKQGYSIQYLTPNTVIDIIQQKQLYQG